MKSVGGDSQENTAQRAFNLCHICTRLVIANASGSSKGRVRVSKAGKVNDPSWVPQIPKFLCALHTMCERYTRYYHDDWFPVQLIWHVSGWQFKKRI